MPAASRAPANTGKDASSLADVHQTGGLLTAIESDIGSVRVEPWTKTSLAAFEWIIQAFKAAGVDVTLGVRLGPLLEELACWVSPALESRTTYR